MDQPQADGRTLLLTAVERLRHDERAVAWHQARRASAAAPRDGLVRAIAARLLWLLGDDRAALAESRAAVDLGVASAVSPHLIMARDAGWYHETCALLERVLQEAGPGDPMPDGLSFARALEQLVRLYFDHHDHAAAAAALDRYLALAPAAPLLSLHAARVYHQRGDSARTEAVLRSTLASGQDSSTARVVGGTLVELGAIDEAETLYRQLLDAPATAPLAREALARLCLARGDLDGALAEAGHLPAESAVARRVRAAVAVLRGDAAAALPLLDAVLRDDPDDGEAHLWRAEANLRLGRGDESCRDADRSLQRGYSYAACAVRMLAVLPPARPPGSWQSRLRHWRERARALIGARPNGALLHARQELRAELGATCDDADLVLARDSATDLVDLLERSLAALRGSRTPPGTWQRADGRLAVVPPSASPRILSRQALELIRVAPVEESFRELDALAARFPDSSMPVVHRGELQLWLGRYAEARADLEASIAIRRQTRWAWYGLTWLDILAGDPEKALDTCAHGIRVMDNSEGPVAMICRGEAYRLLGRLDEARDQLERSNAQHATRVSGWINLALVHSAAGDGAAQRTVMQRIVRMAPSLVSEAAAELGDEVFERLVLARAWTADGPPDDTIDRVLRHTLTMMRGNRASGLITWFTAAGQLRHVPRHQGGGRFDPAAEAQALERIEQTLTRAVGR